MKTASVVILGVVLICGGVFADEQKPTPTPKSLDSLKASVGVNVGLEYLGSNDSIDTTVQTLSYPTTTTPYKATIDRDAMLVNVGVYFDAIYALASVNLSLQLGKTKVTTKQTATVTNTSVSEVETNAGTVEFIFAGKLPIKIVEGLVVFPLLGFSYDVNLLYKNKDQLTTEQKADLNDLYVLLGAGGDLYLSRTVYLRGLVKIGLNLTAAPSGSSSSNTYGGYKTDIGVALGFTF